MGTMKHELDDCTMTGDDIGKPQQKNADGLPRMMTGDYDWHIEDTIIHNKEVYVKAIKVREMVSKLKAELALKEKKGIDFCANCDCIPKAFLIELKQLIEAKLR